MATKPAASKDRVRVRARSMPTRDSYQNLEQRLGLGADNALGSSQYALNPVTRNRGMMEFAYRGSWIVRQAVDIPADDMTGEGLLFEKGVTPEDAERIQADMSELGVMNGLAETIKWARLYGGALGYLMIDGQAPDTPLNLDRIEKGQFRGITALDRWQVQPTFSDPVTELGPDFGKPKFYDVLSYASGLNGQRLHYSRVLRFEGDPLPYWQRIAEMGWGASVIEGFFDRLTSFDSTTTGIAQLVYRAYLRTLKIDGLRAAIVAGSKALDGVVSHLDWMRKTQGIEGMTILDAKDTFETHAYSFSGLDQVLLQFGQQLSGALQIPLVRLFGQSPSGLNSSGESDLRTYYDGIARRQRRERRNFNRVARLAHNSTLGRPTNSLYDFAFAPLYQISDKEKAEIAVQTASAVTAAYDSSLIDAPTAMRELRQSSETTGIFTNIGEEQISQAVLDPPPRPGEMAEGLADDEDDGADDQGDGGAESAPPAKDDVREEG